VRPISAALAVGLVLAAVQAQAKDPLRDQLKSDQDGLCYRRDYDAAHRKRVPGQATQSVLLSFRKDATRIMLRMRGRDHYIVAACDWSDKAAYDTSGQLMIKAFKGPGGYDCIVMVSPESAEEGGYVLLDLAGGDGGSLTLHADSPVKARARLDMKARVVDLKLGAEDREFRLARTNRAACSAMEKVLKGP
jgi:hypothetical protein